MGHNIRAIIGTHKSIQKLTNDWVFDCFSLFPMLYFDTKGKGR